MIILNFGYINLLMKTAVFKLNTIYVYFRGEVTNIF